jgi:hypothetical protein
MGNQLEKYYQCERCHKHTCQTNQEHVNQICEIAHSNQHHKADRKHVVSQPIHKSDIIQGEAVIYLDDAGTKHLTLLVIPKSYILLM